MTSPTFGTADRNGEFGIERRRSGVSGPFRGARRGLVAVGLGAAMVLPIATTIAAPKAGAAGCQSQVKLVKGNPATFSCGPASAKLHYKGKTYGFKPGTCISGGELTLGKNSDVKGNAGLNGMSIAYAGDGVDVSVAAYHGNVHLSATGTGTKFGRTGTIKGTFDSAPFTVTWNCGGAPSKD
jgi:hypothetical protein